MTATPYVLVIHGTWNPPVEGQRLWFQLDADTPGNFCHELNEHLSRRGLGRPVWRSWGQEPPEFGWSGANQHADRIDAGDKLFDFWRSLLAADPTARIHLVGHSHGGNVMLRAVERYLGHLETEATQIAAEAEKATEQLALRDAVVKAVQTQFGAHADFVQRECAESLAILGESSLSEANSADPFPLLLLPTGFRATVRSWFDQLKNWRQSLLTESRGGELDLGPFAPVLGPLRRWMAEHQESADQTQAKLRQRQVRAARETFVDAWVKSHSSNRLGALCFLGTPFMTKTWAQHTWWAPNALMGYIFDVIASVALAGFGAYLVVLMLWAELWLLVSGILWISTRTTFYTPELWPQQWPVWLQAISGFYFVVGSIGGTIALIGERTRSSYNPYFKRSIRVSASSATSSNVPFRSLVINAGLFDEVFLGFSSEPLVYGGLQPQLYALQDATRGSLLRRLWTVSFWLPPKSVLWDQPQSNLIEAAARMLLHSMLVLPRTFIAGPIVIWLWDRHLTRRLVRLISAFAYGVPVHEFAGALIVATNSIGRPDYFEEQVYDATRILAETALLSPESSSRRVARYSFLWDSSELERRKQSSILWRNLAPLTPDISKRYRLYPSVSRSELEGRLAQTSIMLEERMRELIGTVELIHSSYYSNPEIVLRVADFIAGGAHKTG